MGIPLFMRGYPTKGFMSDNVETKYRCIMDIAKTLSMEEIQVLEKMLLELWFNKLETKET